MKTNKKSWLAALCLLLLMLIAVFGLSLMTRQIERAAGTDMAVVTASPVPEDDDEI